MYTLGQAAKATGLSKSWLSKAISNGKISARKDESGRFHIDPAELHRVFPPASAQNVDSEQMETAGNASENSGLRLTVEHLRELIEELKGERERDQETIGDLRRRLDQETEERRRLTLMITHNPQPSGHEQREPAAAQPFVRPVFWGALILAAAAAAWWYWFSGASR